METLLVALIVGSAALYLLSRLRRALSGKSGCGCGGCSGAKRSSGPTACSCCTPLEQQNCAQK